MTEDNPNAVQAQMMAACPGPWQEISDTPGGHNYYQTSEALIPLRVTLEEVVDFITHYSPAGTDVLEEFSDFFTRVMSIMGEGDSVATGQFDPSSPLRDEVNRADCMGAGTDPGEMGNAEKYFRDLQQDEAQEGCPDDCPCMTPEEMPF
jgi:hypothetical protein